MITEPVIDVFVCLYCGRAISESKVRSYEPNLLCQCQGSFVSSMVSVSKLTADANMITESVIDVFVCLYCGRAISEAKGRSYEPNLLCQCQGSFVSSMVSVSKLTADANLMRSMLKQFAEDPCYAPWRTQILDLLNRFG